MEIEEDSEEGIEEDSEGETEEDLEEEIEEGSEEVIEEDLEEEVLPEEEEDQEELRFSSSHISTKECSSLKEPETIFSVPRTSFLGNQSITKRESVSMERMEKKSNTEYGTHTDQRSLLLF